MSDWKIDVNKLYTVQYGEKRNWEILKRKKNGLRDKKEKYWCMCLIIVPEGENRKNGRQEVFEKKIADIEHVSYRIMSSHT